MGWNTCLCPGNLNMMIAGACMSLLMVNIHPTAAEAVAQCPSGRQRRTVVVFHDDLHYPIVQFA